MTKTNFKSMEEYLQSLGLNPEELLTPKYYAYDWRAGYDFIMEAIRNQAIIYLIGDYDVDGIMASYEAIKIVEKLGGTVICRIPRRMSEGYGLSKKIIDELPDGAYIMTVDNGIVANDAIQEAKRRGMRVMVTDHHLPSDVLPEADIIYNPHIGGSDFKEYCAAGMMYKFAEYLFGPCDFTNEIAVMATIGTIADMMPILGDNRNLVKYGLYLINSKNAAIPLALRLLIDSCGQARITETNIGFNIAPKLNAPGRLIDDGSKISLDFLLTDNYQLATERLERINALNDERKELTKDFTEKIQNMIESENLYSPNKALCINYPDVPEGIVGIIAGQLASIYNVPVFCMSNTENRYIKGSARGNDMLHIKDALNKYEQILLKFGGHEGAGGFSLEESNVKTFIEGITSLEIDNSVEKKEYDISIKQDEIEKWNQELTTYEPYGISIPKPMFMIEEFVSTGSEGYGSIDKSDPNKIRPHLTLYGANKAKGFHMYKKYLELGKPKRVTLLGYPETNYWNGQATVQFNIKDIRKSNIQTEKSKEAQFLNNLK